MSHSSIEELLLPSSANLRLALETISRYGHGIAFVCDDDGHLVGVVTDGDARRAIVRGATLESPVVEIMNASPVAALVSAEAEELLEKLGRHGDAHPRLTHVPLLDAQNRVVDFASLQHLRAVQIASPDLSGNELGYVVECIKTGWISSQGNFVREFERMIGEFCGMPHSLAVSNGTVALHLALEALGIGPGDEVLVPDFTFAASINAICHAGATPVLVDVDRGTWTLAVDQAARAITPRTKAIMVVHLYGQPADMDPILALASRHRLAVVEDCAEAFGSEYKNIRVGAFGHAAAFSFFGNKTITTGEGGMVLFRDADVAARARVLRDHGMSPHKRYWHEHIGFNYRMTNLQAALGVAQMERIETFLARKRRLSDFYDSSLRSVPGIRLRESPEWSANVCWLYTVLIEDAAGLSRDQLIAELSRKGIETRPVFYPLHEMPPYQAFGHQGAFPVTGEISSRGLSLPSAVDLTAVQQVAVVRAVEDALAAAQQTV